MSYFVHFPFVSGYNIQGVAYNGIDITKRTGFVRSDVDYERISIEYDIKEGETPEMLADRMYDDPGLYWVVMMLNQLHDVDSDWPLTQEALRNYVNEIYDDVNGIHHYIAASTGAHVDSDYPDYDRIPVTNFEYEYELNEEKRSIRLLLPEYIGDILSQHKRLMRGN